MHTAQTYMDVYHRIIENEATMDLRVKEGLIRKWEYGDSSSIEDEPRDRPRINMDYRIVPVAVNARVIIEALHDGASWSQVVGDV